MEVGRAALLELSLEGSETSRCFVGMRYRHIYACVVETIRIRCVIVQKFSLNQAHEIPYSPMHALHDVCTRSYTLLPNLVGSS